MLEKIKIYFLSRKKFLARKDEVEKIVKEDYRLMDAAMGKTTPELVLEKVMKRGIEWFDYDKLDNNRKKEYYNDIQAVITNGSFINELNHLVADQVEYIAREARNWEEVMSVRMTINAVDMIKQRLESVPDPKQPLPSMDDINEAI